jgi:hypothetical protein
VLSNLRCAMFNYKPRPAILTLLHLLDYAVENDAYAKVLDVLGQGINEAKLSGDRANLLCVPSQPNGADMLGLPCMTRSSRETTASFHSTLILASRMMRL